jgi:hypothetical protein
MVFTEKPFLVGYFIVPPASAQMSLFFCVRYADPGSRRVSARPNATAVNSTSWAE